MAPAQVIEPKDLPPELLVQAIAGAPGLARAVAMEPASPTVEPAHAGSAAGAGVGTNVAAVANASGAEPAEPWLTGLEHESRALLESGVANVWDTLTRKFEAQLIHTALEITRGRRIEAAQKLGIGRNTITRKIQELGLDD
jgi:two-component system nitrogen regulation response regulator GlnG